MSRKRAESTNYVARAHSVHNSGVDFDAINAAAMAQLPALCIRWLPDGRREGREWSTRNPRRVDRRAGSFKVNLVTGQLLLSVENCPPLNVSMNVPRRWTDGVGGRCLLWRRLRGSARIIL